MKKIFTFVILGIAVMLCSGCANNTEVAVKDQSFWKHNNISVCEEGYYIVQAEELAYVEYKDENGNLIPAVAGAQVLFFDIESQQLIPWCNRADCTHNNIFCDSFFENEKWERQIYVCGDYVYMLSKDEDYYYLERFDKDRSNNIRVGKLCLVSEYDVSFGLRFLDGDMYYVSIDGDNNISTLIKIDTGLDGTKETIFETEANQTLSKLRFGLFEKQIIFGVLDRSDDKYQTRFYRYDFEGGISDICIYDEKILSAVITENELWVYRDGEGLICRSINDGDERIVYQENNKTEREVYSDGKYIYLDNTEAGSTYYINAISGEVKGDDNSCYYMVFDLDGNLVDTLEIGLKQDDDIREFDNAEGYPYAFFGDDRYMFMTYMQDDGQLLVYNKQNIGQENHSIWEEYYWGIDRFDYSENAYFSNHAAIDTVRPSGQETEDGSYLSEEQYDEEITDVGAYYSSDNYRTFNKWENTAFVNGKMYYYNQHEYGTENSGFYIYWVDLETGEQGRLKKIFRYNSFGMPLISYDNKLYITEIDGDEVYLAEVNEETAVSNRKCYIGTVYDFLGEYDSLEKCLLSAQNKDDDDDSNDIEMSEKEIEEFTKAWELSFIYTKSAGLQNKIRLDKGYAYCLINDSSELIRFNIESGAKEEIWKRDKEHQFIIGNSVILSEGTLFFALKDKGCVENGKEYDKVYQINENNNKITISEIAKLEARSNNLFALYRSNETYVVYYDINRGLIRRNSDTEYEEIINENIANKYSRYDLFSDGYYIYIQYPVDDKDEYAKELDVFELTGELINSYSLSNTDNSIDKFRVREIGDEHYIFCEAKNENAEFSRLCLLNKKELLTTGNLEKLMLNGK